MDRATTNNIKYKRRNELRDYEQYKIGRREFYALVRSEFTDTPTDFYVVS